LKTGRGGNDDESTKTKQREIAMPLGPLGNRPGKRLGLRAVAEKLRRNERGGATDCGANGLPIVVWGDAPRPIVGEVVTGAGSEGQKLPAGGTKKPGQNARAVVG
jgi:hypothetical protein